MGLGRVLAMPPASLASLEAGRREDRLWVAVSPLNQPVGFALMKFPGGTAWLDQLSVLDRWQGRGHGSRADRPHRGGGPRRGAIDALYLSTYRDVPWNAPFYARRGFEEVPRGELAARVPSLQFLAENSHGHPPLAAAAIMRSDERSLRGDR